MQAKYYRMPVQRKAVDEGKKRVFLYHKEFALKTYTIYRPRNYYEDNDIRFVDMKPGFGKGNEVLLGLEFDSDAGVYTETWANRTKYMRANKLGKYGQI